MLCSWDAEEPGMHGSTEWVEVDHLLLNFTNGMLQLSQFLCVIQVA